MHRSKMHSPLNHLIGANQRRISEIMGPERSRVLSVIPTSTMSVAGPANRLAGLAPRKPSRSGVTAIRSIERGYADP